ncbi:MAG: hypothetical protein M0026_03630 [Nocardiopsaceae bacterium]|nr:hypothetical protein [Nocardiopsaceae bacterium]
MRTVPDQTQPPPAFEARQESQDQQGRDRLDALGAHLRGRRLVVALNDDGGLTVTVSGGDGHPAQSVVTCRRRPSDSDRYWFWDGTTSITEATPEHFPDAGAHIAANLHRLS